MPKRRDAAAIAAAAAISALRRQLAELQRTTAPRAAAEAAHARRLERLQAALQVFARRHTGPVAAAVGRPPEAVRPVLDRFAARLIADLAMSTRSRGSDGNRAGGCRAAAG